MRGLFSDAMPAERAPELAAIMRETRPVGTRTMAPSPRPTCATLLPSIAVPTLVVCGDAAERSPLT